jgi:hypothetical protein
VLVLCIMSMNFMLKSKLGCIVHKEHHTISEICSVDARKYIIECFIIT